MRSAFFTAWAALAALASSPVLADDPAQDSRAATEAIVKDYLASHPEEIGAIVREYFVRHPEAVGQILAELLKHRRAAPGDSDGQTAPDRSAAIALDRAALFSSSRQVALGDPNGDVTLVEFFDYNCGFCRRALADTLTLLSDDPHLKIVLKEYPILGPGSAEAARVAVAARMQDPAKYLAFHRALLGRPGPASEAKALASARDAGYDMERLAKDMASGEPEATIAADMKLASALGVSGTPSYVIGDETVMGAVGTAAPEAKIARARAAARQ